jgi:hypothetical protein
MSVSKHPGLRFRAEAEAIGLKGQSPNGLNLSSQSFAL